MRVGVDLAVHEDLVQVTADQRRRQRVHRLFGTAHIGNGIHAYAAGQFHGQHAMTAVIPQRLRNPQAPERLQMATEARQVLSLGVVVQLLHQGLGELVEPVAQAHAAADLGQVVGGQGEAAQHLQIRTQLRGHFRLLHFHRHLAAVMQHRAMHLGDGRTAQRLRIECGEQLVHRRAQLLLDDGVDAFDRNRRHLLLHPLQRGGELHRHHVRAGGQHLPELDEGRPQRFQVTDELLGVAVGRHIGVAAGSIQIHAREHAGMAVAHQQAQDLAAPVHATNERGIACGGGRLAQTELLESDAPAAVIWRPGSAGPCPAGSEYAASVPAPR
ncbi:hypothetical protein D3C72_966000 [compost metagenome]